MGKKRGYGLNGAVAAVAATAFAAISLFVSSPARGEFGVSEVRTVADRSVKVSDLVSAPGGDFYATLSGQGEQVVRLSATGEVLRAFQVPDWSSSSYNFQELDVDGAGNVAVIDDGNAGGAYVFRFRPDGTLLNEFRISRDAYGLATAGIAADFEGNLYVPVRAVGSRPAQLVKFAPDGSELARWNLAGQPSAVDLDSETVFVLTHTTITRFRTSGEVLGAWQVEQPGFPTHEFDFVASDQQTFVLYFAPTLSGGTGPGGPITYPGRATVNVLGENGESIDEFGCYGGTDERLADARAITTDQSGRAVIASANQLKVFSSGLDSPCVITVESTQASLRQLGVSVRCSFDACTVQSDGFVKTKGVRIPLKMEEHRVAENGYEPVSFHFADRGARRMVRKHLKRRDGWLQVHLSVADDGGRTETVSARIPLER